MEPFRIVDVRLSDEDSLLFSTSPLQVRQQQKHQVRHEASMLQMSELGLPSSFSSTSRKTGSRRARHRRRNLSYHQVTTSLDDEFSQKLCVVVDESFVHRPLQFSLIDSVQVSIEGSLEDAGTRVSNYEANHCVDANIRASSNDEQEEDELNVGDGTARRTACERNAGDGTNRCTQCNNEASLLPCGVMHAASMLASDMATAQTEVMVGSTELIVLNGGDVVPGEEASVSEMATKYGSDADAMVSVSKRDKEVVCVVSNSIAGETIPLNVSSLQAVDAGGMDESASCEGTDARVDNLLVEVAKSLIPEEVQISNWSAYWDDYYGRYYFYNTETLESTWEPPTGFKAYAYISAVQDSNKASHDSELNGVSNSELLVANECEEGEIFLDDGSKPGSLLHGALGVEVVPHLASVQSNFADVYDGAVPQKVVETEGDQEHVADIESSLCQEIATMASAESSAVHVDVATCKVSVPSTRQAKEAVSLLVRLEDQCTEMAAAMVDHSPSIFKYWAQRFRLFSKYDSGVKLDEEGWFSVTPEAIAKHQAARCKSGVIVDAFTGVGGNAIQFALAGHYVVAVDNDPKKIEYARHNAMVYGVISRIDFVLGDFFAVSSSMQADVVFLSPPWGGPDYLNVKVYDIVTMLQPKDGVSLFKVAQAIAPNIIFFLPRNVDMNQLAELSKTSSFPCSCEVERNFLNGKLKAVTAYYGQFAGMEV